MTPKQEKAIRELIADGKRNPRGVMALTYAIKHIQDVGLTLWDIYPYVTSSEYMKPADCLDELRQHKVTVHLIFYKDDDNEAFSKLLDSPETVIESPFVIETVHPTRDRFIGAGLGVGMPEILGLAYKFLAGKEMDTSSPYIGTGRTAELLSERAVNLLEEMLPKEVPAT